MHCFNEECRKRYHGHICSEVSGLLQEIKGYLRFKCFDCSWQERTSSLELQDDDYVLLKKIERQSLYRFCPFSLSTHHLKLRESHEKEIPKGIRQFPKMKEDEFIGEVLNQTEDLE